MNNQELRAFGTRTTTPKGTLAGLTRLKFVGIVALAFIVTSTAIFVVHLWGRTQQVIAEAQHEVDVENAPKLSDQRVDPSRHGIKIAALDVEFACMLPTDVEVAYSLLAAPDVKVETILDKLPCVILDNTIPGIVVDNIGDRLAKVMFYRHGQQMFAWIDPNRSWRVSQE